MNYVFAFAFFFFAAKSYSQTCLLNFGSFPGSSVTNCVFDINGLQMELFSCCPFIPDPIQYCSSTNDASVFTAKIQKEDIPNRPGFTTSIHLVSCSCPGITDLNFRLHYDNQPLVETYQPSVSLNNFNDLAFIEITEVECGLVTLFNGSTGIPPVVIKFEFTPSNSQPQGTCGNAAIASLESKLDSGPFTGDYHSYVVENVVCDKANFTGSGSCTVDDVYEFVKSNNVYQAPTYADFPTGIFTPLPFIDCAGYIPFNRDSSLYGIIGNALGTLSNSGPYGVPITDCMEMNLSPTPTRVIAGILSNLPNLSLWPDIHSFCTVNTNVANEPIKIIVDDERKCITNYTLPGHILHPGKVERCVVPDDCGDKIKVVTKGTGFHVCGDNFAGRFFSCVNKYIGPITFQNIDNRLISKFND